MSNWIRLTKIAATSCPHTPSASPENYLYGSENLLSPPIDYWLEGFLFAPPKVGETLKVDRRIRNGVVARGFFESSPITAVDGNRVTTMNSIYFIEEKPQSTL
jgi:hypothetical protein